MREKVKKYLSVIISLLLVLSVFGGELSARDAQAKTVNRVFKGKSICHFNHFCRRLWSRQCRQLSFFHRTSLLTAPSLRTDPSALQAHSTSS